MQYYVVIDETGAPVAFLNDAVHATIPPDAKPITKEQWAAWVADQTLRWPLRDT